MQENEEISETKIKRRRGRPRKYPRNSPNDTESEKDNEEYNKKEFSENSTENIKENKNFIKSENSEESDSSSFVKRNKKGRARKKQNSKKDKKENKKNIEKRGRPKKTISNNSKEQAISALNSILEITDDVSTHELLAFHLRKKKEFNKLIQTNNLCFYGYGEKKKLVSKIFSSINKIDCNNKSDLDCLQELYECILGVENTKSIGIEKTLERINEINSFCRKSKNRLFIILFNPSINFMNLMQRITTLRKVFTQDSLDFKYSKNFIAQHKIIFSDLSTFLPYENVGITKFDNSKSLDIYKVVMNVPKRSKNIFIEVLKLCAESNFKKSGFKIDLIPFLELVKEKFLITDVNLIHLYLVEFVEHSFLKRVEEGYSCKFTAADAKEVIESLK